MSTEKRPTICLDNLTVRLITPSLVQVSRTGLSIGLESWLPATLDAVEYSVDRSDTATTIQTEDLVLVYDPTSKDRWPFTLEILSTGTVISDLAAPDRQNLGGVPQALDNKAGQCPIPDGLLSRRGWNVASLVEDSRELTPGVESDDLFIFAYGTDYYKGLADLTTLTGKVPMLPKWSLGSWFSQYFEYTDEDYKDIVERYRKEQIPIDVVICDMNWHVDGWYGTRYNAEMFPDMPAFIQWVHDKGLRIGFNHHPGGLSPDETRLPAFLDSIETTVEELQAAGEALPEKARDRVAQHNGIPFDFMAGNFDQFDAYFETFLQPLMKDGLDFHWIDYDVGEMSPRIFEQYLKRTEEHAQERGIILTRMAQGSLLNHRTPLAFSGDEWMMWDALKQEIEVTLGGQNNGILWSHDIWGFKPNRHGKDKPTVEKAVRWIQFGALSPTMRLHSGHPMRYTEQDLPEWMISRQFWDWGEEVLEAGRTCIQLRYALMPYLYTHLERFHSQSRPIFKGMYYDYPERQEAYECTTQYMLGDDLLFAPIDQPSGEETEGKAEKTLWLPEGEWVDFFSDEALTGGCTLTVQKAIQEFPLYVRAGSILPMAEYKDRITEPDHALLVHIYYNASVQANTFTLYEDDGISFDHRDGKSATTNVSYKTTGAQLQVTIEGARGSFRTQPEQRQYDIVIHNCPTIDAAQLNGNPVDPKTCFYDSDIRTLTVSCPKSDIRADAVLILDLK